MKQCKCEHWQQCPVCMPHRFDADGNVLHPKLTPLEEAREKIERLTAENAAQLAELHRISEALGTNEGHSSVYWVETIVARGHRLALELECLLLDCKDMAIVSKWMDSGMEAVSEWHESFPYNGPRLGD